MGLSKKIIKCTITFVTNPSFSCDFWLWQNIPSELGIYGGHFERIKNEKILQVEANEGTWELNPIIVPGTFQPVSFFKNPRLPKSAQIFDLTEVPFDFIDLVIAGKVLSQVNRGAIYKPIAQLNWRMWC